MKSDPFSISKRCRRNAPDWIVAGVDSLRSCQFLYPFTNRIPYYSESEALSPFFIVGCGRSGNTVLRTQLCSHYQVVIPPEIPGLGNTIRAFRRSRHKHWPCVVRATLKEFRCNADQTVHYPNARSFNLHKTLGLNFEKIEADLYALNKENQSASAIISRIYSDYVTSRHGQQVRIGDKTPWNVFHLERIVKVFPRSSYLHLIRNPLGAVASYVHNFSGALNVSVRAAALRWRDSVARWESFRRLHPKIRTKEISFEKLLETPDDVLQEVSVFFQVRPEQEKKQPKIAFGDEGLPHYAKAFQSLDASTVNKWKNLLTTSEQEQVRRICGTYMTSRGY